MNDTTDAIRREMRVYVAVFAALAVLTALTVTVRLAFDVPIGKAIGLALAIASIKAFLIAAFFMHLLREKRVVYGVLVLTAVIFIALLWLPLHDVLDKFGRF